MMYLPEQVPVRALLVAHNAGTWGQQEHQAAQLSCALTVR